MYYRKPQHKVVQLLVQSAANCLRKPTHTHWNCFGSNYGLVVQFKDMLTCRLLDQCRSEKKISKWNTTICIMGFRCLTWLQPHWSNRAIEYILLFLPSIYNGTKNPVCYVFAVSLMPTSDHNNGHDWLTHTMVNIYFNIKFKDLFTVKFWQW